MVKKSVSLMSARAPLWGNVCEASCKAAAFHRHNTTYGKSAQGVAVLFSHFHHEADHSNLGRHLLEQNALSFFFARLGSVQLLICDDCPKSLCEAPVLRILGRLLHVACRCAPPSRRVFQLSMQPPSRLLQRAKRSSPTKPLGHPLVGKSVYVNIPDFSISFDPKATRHDTFSIRIWGMPSSAQLKAAGCPCVMQCRWTHTTLPRGIIRDKPLLLLVH
jgi:hypothetical protein